MPEENRLGDEGEGFKLAETWLVHARIPYAAAVIGVAQAALQLAIDWAKQRETFGSQLADKQAIQWMIADCEIELRAARLLVYQAAWKGDLGQDIKVDASICKVYATEIAGKVVDRCIQMFGGLGVAQRDAAGALVPRDCASSASAKAPRRCTAWWSRATCSAASASERPDHVDRRRRRRTASPPSRSTAPSG